MDPPNGPDLVEEPKSGMLLPAEFQGPEDLFPKELLGIALRVKRVMGMQIQVYAIGFYGAPSLLASEGASSLQASLLRSKEEKVFCITFLRSLPYGKVVDAFRETLGDEFGVPAEWVSAFLVKMPTSIARGTEIRLRIRPQQNEVVVTGDWLPEGGAPIQSPELCSALHEMYFGPRSIVLGLEESLQARRTVLQRNPQRKLSFTEADGTSFEASGLSGDDAGSFTGTSGTDSPDRGAHMDPDSPGDVLPSIRSGTELADASLVNSSFLDQDGSPTRSRSWKDRSGREGGGEGYRFGDITRAVMHKTRGSRRFQATSVGPWQGALQSEGEEEPWVALDPPRLDEAAVSQQRLSAVLYKHHISPVRGNLVPQWSPRYFELHGGTLRYRRRQGGSIKGSLSLDGACVVLEPVKSCHAGDCYVFRVVSETGQMCRLSCSDRETATSFALAAAGTCAFFRERSFPSNCVQEFEAVPQTEQPPSNTVVEVAPGNEVPSEVGNTTEACSPPAEPIAAPLAPVPKEVPAMSSQLVRRAPPGQWTRLRHLLPALLAALSFFVYRWVTQRSTLRRRLSNSGALR